MFGILQKFYTTENKLISKPCLSHVNNQYVRNLVLRFEMHKKSTVLKIFAFKSLHEESHKQLGLGAVYEVCIYISVFVY